MDSAISAAARSLAAGDPLAALKRVALREDPPALALRGIAMAQLGDFERSRSLLRKAARQFGPGERLARARCLVAEAEVALAARDLAFPIRSLSDAGRVLEALGDHVNAFHARLVIARRHLLVGDVTAARQTLESAAALPGKLPPALIARAEFTRAELALRQVQAKAAATALDRAHAAATAAGIPALIGEIDRMRTILSAPSARLIRNGATRLARLDEVEAVYASRRMVVDVCRRVVGDGSHQVSLARRPVLLELAAVLAEAWPADVAREALIKRVFQARVVNESHRARLRVQIGRLRATVRSLARIEATPRGFLLAPVRSSDVVVLAPPIDGPAGAILALLGGGESWSTSALACALGSSQRTVQRALRELVATSAVRAVGRGRSKRWLAPALGGFATTLLLPGSPPMG